MIIYGRRSTHIKTEFIFDQCPNCQNSNTIYISIYQWYAHIFWVPLFPIGRYGVSVCNHCHQVLKDSQMPGSLKFSFFNVKKNAKTPIWTFIGAALIGILIVNLYLSDKATKIKTSQLISAPKKNDVIKIKLKQDIYTTYLVNRVNHDTVYFYANKYQTNVESGLSDLANKDFDTSKMYLVPIHNLVEMSQQGEIIGVDRN